MAASKKGEETVSVNLAALLDAGDGAVVTVVAGDTRLAAHRAVLSARSPAFAAMLGHGARKARDTELTVADVDGRVLRELLAYLYTLQAPQLPDTAPQLLAAADKYGVSGLKAECERRVAARLSVENAAAAALLAVRHGCPDLQQAAVAFIKAHTHQVMATRGWADAVLDRPRDLLEVSRLLADPPVESSPAAGTQGQSQSSRSQTPVDAGLPTAPPSGGASGSQMRPTAGTQGQTQSSRSQSPVAAGLPTGPLSGGASGSQRRPSAGTQGQSQSSRSQSPVATGLPTAPPSGGASGSQMWSHAAEEKGRMLIKAAEEGAVKKLRKLLAAGADVRARDENESTALHIAARDGLVGAVRSLLQSGAEVDARDHWRFTPLHWAAQNDHTDVVRLLVGASADLDAKDMYGGTPLHSAAYVGQEEAAAVLLQAGADWMARDDGGNMPLDLARNSCNKELIEMLYCYSYDPSDFS